jgi:NTE family protein
VVIAVNVGSPLLKAEDVGSLLTVTAQMVNILTEQNVTRSIASLTPRDIYIRPDLDGIGAADFERHAETADRGRAPPKPWRRGCRAVAAAGGLCRVAPALRAGDARRRPGRRHRGGRPGRVHPDTVQRHLRQRLGETLDTTRLGRDLVRVFGEGDFEQVDYSLVREGERNVLRIDAAEKRWGPDYLRLGLALSTTLSQGASYALRVAWHKTWLNAWGGELLAVGELGNTNGVSLEWFQPLATPSRWFSDGSLQYRRQRLDLFAGNDRVSEYVIEQAGVGLGVGMKVSYLGHLRLGVHSTRWKPSLVTGLPLLTGDHAQKQGLALSLDLDRLNRRFFPTSGWALNLGLVDNRGEGPDYTRATLDLRHAWALPQWVIGSRVAWTGSPRGRLPVYDGASLGGFLNLSAYSPNQVAGDAMAYAHLRAERVIGNMPLGLRGDLRLGLALELAEVRRSFVVTRHTGTLHSLAAYVGGDTPIGPVYLGLAHSLSGVFNAYLFVGAP